MPTHPPRPTRGPLADAWDQPAHLLFDLPYPDFAPGLAERHRIFSLLVLALTHAYWNGNKYGKSGQYRDRDGQRFGGTYAGGDYLGHNIAAIAVDGHGDIIDFDFNHNEILNSSVEHAESRLVRRVFSLSQLGDGWQLRPESEADPSRYYATQLSQVTIYTSLESCAQCSGIMALGSVKQVVFLQRDPGQASVGNLLRHLMSSKSFSAPLPIPADTIGLEQFRALDAAYAAFAAAGDQPFFTPDVGRPVQTTSITSFLCTDTARSIFRSGAEEFAELAVTQPYFRPDEDSLTNAEVLERARRFLRYAVDNAFRGTAHRV